MKRQIILVAAITSLVGIPLPTNAGEELKAGDDAPAFTAKDQDEKTISSEELYKSGTTLLFFFPKAGTGG